MKMISRMASLALLLSLPTVVLAAEPPPANGVSLQLHAHRSTGWTQQEEALGSPVPLTVNISDGAGAGLRLGYEFIPHVGLFASGELNVEDEGLYTGFGAGLVLRTPLLGPARAHARLGARWLSPGPGLFFATVGIGGELFIVRRLALGVELDAAQAIAKGTRFTGERDVQVEADGGPLRGIVGLTWYFGD